MENLLIKIKSLSSLEKCFLDEKLRSKKETNKFIMFKNERLSFQFAYEMSPECDAQVIRGQVKLSGKLAKYAKVRRVVSVPSYWAERGNADYDYLRTEPGLYPDMLCELQYRGKAVIVKRQLHSLWIDIKLPEDFTAGDYDLTLKMFDGEKVLGEKAVKIQVLSAELPKQKTIHTEWFYTDCIAQYYGVRAFSEKHWKLIENFMKTAVDNGINMILTPLFTPELDTYIGGERLTTQLLGIKVVGKDKYEFNFDKLGRWIDLCEKCGVEYFEITHFFTQWGANHAPKIVAEVDGKVKKIFGWETEALGDEYKSFLKALLPELVKYLKEKGVDKRCFYHVSDEPSMSALEHYKACREILSEYLAEYPIIDALSNVEFYETGAISKPVPSIQHIDHFLDKNIDGLWAYYCGDGGNRVTTCRLFAHSLTRTRILGVQMYKYNIEGFLHWGYNFYNNWNSYDTVDPCLDSTGNYFVPSGDTYIVYPGKDGKALESIRLNAMREAMDDIKALQRCEELYGREYVINLIDETAGTELTFFDYPKTPDFLINLRNKVALAIERF